MRIARTKRLTRSYQNAPPSVQRAFDKQVARLLENLRHPSLRAKKFDEENDVWQARINRDWRFYFRIEGDVYYLLELMPHPK